MYYPVSTLRHEYQFVSIIEDDIWLTSQYLYASNSKSEST